jgi:hypothetical protein
MAVKKKTPNKKKSSPMGGGGLKVTNKTALYASPHSNPNNYVRRLNSTATDIEKSMTGAQRIESMGFARELYTTMSTLGTSVNSKNAWATINGFRPVYTGKNEEWGNLVEQWLYTRWMPNCNVLGPNYDFETTLYTSAISLDVDGDDLCIPVVNKYNFPLIQIIPSHRICSPRGRDGELKDGPYRGLDIIDGVVIAKSGRPLAYRVDGKDKVLFIESFRCNLLFEPEFSRMHRGISRIARSVLDWLDIQDIDEYVKRGVKLDSSIGILHKTETGDPDLGANIVTDEVSSISPDATISVEAIQGGDIYYLKANSGESLEAFLSNRPGVNSQTFMAKIERRAVASVGWFYELLNTEKVGGGNGRLIVEEAKKSISTRQRTMERRARFMVAWAVAKAMEQGFIPENQEDWYSWNFVKPSELALDRKAEVEMDLKSLAAGTTTVSAVVGKSGWDYEQFIDIRRKEVKKLYQTSVELQSDLKTSLGIDLSLEDVKKQILNTQETKTGDSPASNVEDETADDSHMDDETPDAT